MRFARALLFLASVVATAAVAIDQPGADFRGIYIYTNDVSQVTNATSNQLAKAIAQPGVDGVAIVLGWNALEPSMGKYDWTLLDQWINLAVTLGRKIDLVIPAGSATPDWLFNPAPSGAGATKLSFEVSPHSGLTGKCDSTIIAPPWDPAFLAQWDAMLAAVAAHLKSAGTYNAVTLVRLTGINRTTEETRLPIETAATTGLACVTDAITTWEKAGYKPSLLLKAWNSLLASFNRSFPDKPFAVSIIPLGSFPNITENGTFSPGPSPDLNYPLLQSAAQLLPGRFVVQFDSLSPGQPAASQVVNAALNLGTMAAFQTNEFNQGQGAGCGGSILTPVPCTGDLFLTMLDAGIYPLGPGNPLMSQYIEVFHANVAAFPDTIVTAHNQLIPQAPPPGANAVLTYNPGSTTRLEQVVGECDWVAKAQQVVAGKPVTCQATASRTVTNGNILGNDLGSTFEANGQLYYLSGDSIAGNSTDFKGGDPIATSTSTDGDYPFLINYLTAKNGSPLFVSATGLATGADNVPNAGISVAGGLFFVYNTGADTTLANPQQNAKSVVVAFDPAALTFTAGRTISQAPNGHSVFTSLHTMGSDVYIFGSGNYRASNIYLSKVTAANFKTGAGTQYFAGMSNGQPVWVNNESGAVAVVVDDAKSPSVGNMSVAYSPQLNLWLMTYDGGRQAEATSGAYFTYAPNPWGPWATPQLIFNAKRDNGRGVFLHDPAIVPDPPGDGLNGPTIGSNDIYRTSGGPYAPLMIERFNKVLGSTLSIYYVMSTWNPYTVVKMRSQFTVTTPSGPGVSITSAPALPAATVGGAYSQVLTAGGGTGSYSWSVAAGGGTLPAGLTLSSAGVLSGIPSVPANGNFTLQVTDSANSSASQSFTLSVGAALLASPDGATAFDPVNGITWLADFNLASSNRFGLPVCKGTSTANQSCVNASGSMTWNSAAAWVAAMNAAQYQGQSNWQFPTSPTFDSNCAKTGPNGSKFGFGCASSAFATLYASGFGLQSPATVVAATAGSIAGFTNLQPYLYWAGQSAGGNGYVSFSMNSGFQGENTEPNFLYVLPMIPGKITGAPAGSTVYDSASDTTWLADGNIAASNTFGLPVCSSPTTPAVCVASTGAMTLPAAFQLVTNMNAAAYLGQKKWQLPPADANCGGYKCNVAANPLAMLYAGKLALSEGAPVAGPSNQASGPFINVQPYLYWTCQGDAIAGPCSATLPAPNFEWSYSLGNGFTGTDLFANDLYVTAYFVGQPSWYAGPQITTSPSLPAATAGTAYTQSLAASGGAASYTFALVAGTLPDGLTLTPDGTISGTPTTAGSSSFTIQVMDSASAFLNQAMSLVVQAPPVVLPAITGISICSASGKGGAGSCPPGTRDTAQIVLSPNGGSINAYNGMTGISDEHQTVFPPGALNGNKEYLFFVASRVTGGAPSTSVMALSGGAGPSASGQWTLDFAKTDGYGAYPNSVYSDIFTSAAQDCPAVTNAANQDQTFDLSYAAPGSVVPDPSGPAGSMLMIYEGTNTCLGGTGGSTKYPFYSMVGIATSLDYGKTWPTYRATPTFKFTNLPGQNPNQGPAAPNGATGAGVCEGNNCTVTPPSAYGRYAVLGPSVTIATAAATGKPLPIQMGDAEMSAFLDDAEPAPAQYVYITYNYHAGTGALADPKGPQSDLMIARAKLNGGTAPLSFLKWNGAAFAASGMGGYDAPVFPVSGPNLAGFSNCLANSQTHYGSSILYVEPAQQYLLLFVCDSPGDPANGKASGTGRGAAWFYSTSPDLSDATKWSVPQEITGSWAAFDGTGGCNSYPGFYPAAMTPGLKSGHLGISGYVFYLAGCQTDNTPPPGRRYSSRAFTITLSSPPLAN